MNKIFFMVILVILSFIYVIVINIYAEFTLFDMDYQQESEIIYGDGDQRIEVGESLSVSVKRNRVYGTIYEYINGDDKIIKLYLFKFIPLPLRYKDKSFKEYHFGFLLLLIFICFVYFMKNKGGKQWEGYQRY